MKIVVVKGRRRIKSKLHERLIFYFLLGFPISLIVRIFT